MYHLIIVFLFICIILGVYANGILLQSARKTGSPYKRAFLLTFLAISLVLFLHLFTLYVKYNIASPGLLLQRILAYGSTVFYGFLMFTIANSGIIYSTRDNHLLLRLIFAFLAVIKIVLGVIFIRINTEMVNFVEWVKPGLLLNISLFILGFVPLFVYIPPSIKRERENPQHDTKFLKLIFLITVLNFPVIVFDIYKGFAPIPLFPIIYISFCLTIIIYLYKQLSRPHTQNTILKPNPEVYTKFKISHREREIIELIFEGLENKDIAKKLFISVPTVKSHIRRIFAKTEVKSRFELIKLIQH